MFLPCRLKSSTRWVQKQVFLPSSPTGKAPRLPRARRAPWYQKGPNGSLAPLGGLMGPLAPWSPLARWGRRLPWAQGPGARRYGGVWTRNDNISSGRGGTASTLLPLSEFVACAAKFNLLNGKTNLSPKHFLTLHVFLNGPKQQESVLTCQTNIIWSCCCSLMLKNLSPQSTEPWSRRE